jgi:hypothetical protein
VYWSPQPVVTNGITYENNRPFLEAKNNEFWDSIAVEATSYALLVYLIRDGVTMIPDRAMSWLNTMRLTDGAFISTVVSPTKGIPLISDEIDNFQFSEDAITPHIFHACLISFLGFCRRISSTHRICKSSSDSRYNGYVHQDRTVKWRGGSRTF